MFWDNLVKLCCEKDTTPTAVAKALNIAVGSVTKWKNGSAPNATTMYKLSEYFGVSVDYLLGKADCAELNKGEDVILVSRNGQRAVHHLTPEQLDILRGMIEQMEKNNRN